MTTGEKIKFYRKLNGMTLEELGEKCGVQKSVVAKWEKGQVDLKASRLTQLGVIFGVLPSSLLDDRYSSVEMEKLIEKIERLTFEDKRRLEAIVDAWIGDE